MRRTASISWIGPWIGLALLIPACARPAAAHVGPPFPILEDQTIGPYRAAVWTDPDIGTATFYVMLEARSGRRLPSGTKVKIAVRPVSGRLPEVVYDTELQRADLAERYYTTLPLDRGEMWTVRVAIDGPQGGGELRSQVEATPAGSIGPIGLVLYPLPFLAIGFLWWRAASKRRAWLREHGGGGARAGARL